MTSTLQRELTYQLVRTAIGRELGRDPVSGRHDVDVRTAAARDAVQLAFPLEV